MDDILAPRCPRCGSEPILAFERQAFCGNDQCPVFTWDKAADPADFEATAMMIDLPPPGATRT